MKERLTKLITAYNWRLAACSLLLSCLPALQSSAQTPTTGEAAKTEASKADPQKPKKKISGQLLDEQGEPLIGASIAVKGTDERAITDIDGNYTIMTAEDNPTLVFSYMGFQTKEIALSQNSMVDGGWPMVNVEMSEDSA